MEGEIEQPVEQQVGDQEQPSTEDQVDAQSFITQLAPACQELFLTKRLAAVFDISMPELEEFHAMKHQVADRTLEAIDERWRRIVLNLTKSSSVDLQHEDVDEHELKFLRRVSKVIPDLKCAGERIVVEAPAKHDLKTPDQWAFLSALDKKMCLLSELNLHITACLEATFVGCSTVDDDDSLNPAACRFALHRATRLAQMQLRMLAACRRDLWKTHVDFSKLLTRLTKDAPGVGMLATAMGAAGAGAGAATSTVGPLADLIGKMESVSLFGRRELTEFVGQGLLAVPLAPLCPHPPIAPVLCERPLPELGFTQMRGGGRGFPFVFAENLVFPLWP